MRGERLIPSFSVKRNSYLSIIFLAATLCFAQAALAQSGRRPKGSVSSPPPTVVNEPKTEPAIDPQTVKPPIPISSVVVAGDLVQSGSSFSNYVDQAVDACVERLKERQVINAKGSGSMKRIKAMDRAKQETDAYVLWLEIKIVDNIDKDYRLNEQICIINYYVFMPQTGKIMTEGRVDPKNQYIRSGGAVLRLPTGNNRSWMVHQLEVGGREVADRVISKFDNSPPRQ